MSLTINPSHPFAVYQYTDAVDDPYYIGKRFISVNDGVPSAKMIVVATAETIEECQTHIDHSRERLREWMQHKGMPVTESMLDMLMEERT